MGDHSEGADEDKARYALVFPFVVCTSNGGPYDDNAFAAGCEFAQVHNALLVLAALGVPMYARHLRATLVPQYELLAMHLGWNLKTVDNNHAPEWPWLIFEKAAEPF